MKNYIKKYLFLVPVGLFMGCLSVSYALDGVSSDNVFGNRVRFVSQHSASSALSASQCAGANENVAYYLGGDLDNDGVPDLGYVKYFSDNYRIFGGSNTRKAALQTVNSSTRKGTEVRYYIPEDNMFNIYHNGQQYSPSNTHIWRRSSSIFPLNQWGRALDSQPLLLEAPSNPSNKTFQVAYKIRTATFRGYRNGRTSSYVFMPVTSSSDGSAVSSSNFWRLKQSPSNSRLGPLWSSDYIKSSSRITTKAIQWSSSEREHSYECVNVTLQRCGDGTKQSNETCDPNDSTKTGWGNNGCSATCKPINVDAPVCGSTYHNQTHYGQNRLTATTTGLCSPGSVASFSGPNASGGYSWKCTNTANEEVSCSADENRCGDGTTQSSNGEQCDLGSQNGAADATCSATCQTVTPVTQNFDLALRKSVASSTPGPFNPGDTVTYYITLVNQGAVNATNIRLIDYIPAGLTLNDPAWTRSGNTATRTVPSLLASRSVVVPITFTIDSGFSGTSISNYAEIASAQDANGNAATDCDSTADTVNGNTPGEQPGRLVDNAMGTGCDAGGDEDDHDIETIPVSTGVADVEITKTVDRQSVVEGQDVLFTLRFSNRGNAVARNVRVTDTLPRGYRFVSTRMLSFGGQPSNPTHTTRGGSNGVTIIEYSGLTLNPNQSGVVEIRATVDARYCSDLTNVSAISTSDTETNRSNNSSSAYTLCDSRLTLDKEQRGGSSSRFTSSTIQVEENDTIRYRITVGHSGAPSRELSIVDELPREVTYDRGLTFSVAGRSRDNLCRYDDRSREITCRYFSLDTNEEAILEFDVEVNNGTRRNEILENEVTLYQNTRRVSSDRVRAELEGQSPVARITKRANKDKLNVGDRVDFAIEFINSGEVDIAAYDIVDTWPADDLALVCGSTLYSTQSNHSSNARSLEICLKDNLRITHSRYNRLDNRDIDFDVSFRGGVIKVTLSFDERDDREHELRPGERISFSLVGEAFVAKTTIINHVEVEYRDDRGSSGWDGSDTSSDYVRVEHQDGSCRDIVEGDTYPAAGDANVGYTCRARGQARTITLDCGNGVTHTAKNTDTFTRACSYNVKGSYAASCRFNGESTAQAACRGRSVSVTPPPRVVPICGNGVREYYEQCDYKDTANKSGWGPTGCSKTCKPLGRPTPGGPQGSKLPSCMMVDTAEAPNGKPIPLSIMNDEKLPFWWAIEDDTTRYTNGCNAQSDLGKLVKSTMKCTFEIYNSKGRIGTIPSTDCHNVDATKLYAASFTDLFAFGQDGGTYVDIAPYAKNHLGEYKIKLSKFTYDVCEKDGDKVVSKLRTSDECCMVNFTVTKPYLIQEGLGATKDFNKALYGTINPLTKYFKMNGATFAKGYTMNYKEIKASDYDGGTAVDNAVSKFVDKYSALAIGRSNSDYKKVPGKNIIIYTGKGTLNASDVKGMDTFTVIVDSKDAIVNIDKNVTQNAMYVIKSGTLKISKGAKVVNGIFVLATDAKLVSDKIRNDDTSEKWISDGSLTINGVIVGGDKSVEGLMKSRRSTLRGWFYKSNKQEMFEQGASLRIRNNPSLWMTPPPGVDELDSVFAVYKK